MRTADFITALARDGERLADLAGRTGWDAGVPTCPRWRVRDLVVHTGSVHRWAAGFLAGRERPAPLEPAGPDDDAALDGWFREGHRALVERLSGAPDDLACWSFLPAPSPLAFWARRQAHETAIHWVDAEAAAGVAHQPFDADLAGDGVDELLAGFHVRPRSRVRTDRPRTLLVRAGAAGPGGARAWLLRLSAEPPAVERLADAGGVPADCVLSGPPPALYRALWNRGGWDEVEVAGDASLAALWRDRSGV